MIFALHLLIQTSSAPGRCNGPIRCGLSTAGTIRPADFPPPQIVQYIVSERMIVHNCCAPTAQNNANSFPPYPLSRATCCQTTTVLFYFYFYLALGQTGRLVDMPRRWSRSTPVYSLAWSSLATCQRQWLTGHVSGDRHVTGRGHSATWNANGRTCCQGRSLNSIDVVNNICK